jgi:BMFP domain-containing protein YqiC
MESSQTLKIMLDMLRSNLADAIASGGNGLPGNRHDFEATLANALENLREDVLSKFELVAKSDYEAQMALVENLRAQLNDLEQRLRELEQQPTN